MKLAALAVLAAAPAYAQVSAELAAGGAAQGGTQTDATGFTTASGTLAAEWSHPAPPLERRGLGGIDDDGNGLWLWTGADPDDRNGVRADATAMTLGPRFLANGHAAARAYGWELDLGVAYQPTGDLREQFWHSGRGVTASTFGMQMPAMLTWGTHDWRASFGAMRFAFTERDRDAGAPLIDGGVDGEMLVHFIAYDDARWHVGVIDMHVTGHEVIESATADQTIGVSTTELAFDFLALGWKMSPELQLTARGGFDQTVPFEHFVDNHPNGQYMDQPPGPSVYSPRYWLELAEHTGDRTASIGAGSWARLDPTGNAADTGQLAAASYGDRFGRVTVRGTAEGGRLRRGMLGMYATPELAPVGTKMWMGRGELAAAIRIERGLSLASTAWVERSDRDDPRWLVPSDGTIETRAGADLTARYAFH